MSAKFYVSVEGARQGQFKGEVGDKMLGVGFSYGVTIPFDNATGLINGPRQQEPISIDKHWGAASPQFLTALITTENLTTVLLEFVRATVEGNEEVFHTIKLTNAIVAQVLQSVPNDVTTNLGLERIRFTFQKVEIENKDGNTKFSDNWATNRA